MLQLRCDASNDNTQPCSRCKKFGLECVVSTTFRRVKRRTYVVNWRNSERVLTCNFSKSELQAELDQLKRRVSASSPKPPPAYSIQVSEPDMAQTSDMAPETTASSRNRGVAPHGQNTRLRTRNFSPTVIEKAEMPPTTPDQATSSTLSQSIQGMRVDAHDIDECFTL